jgi:ATP synthase protein I
MKNTIGKSLTMILQIGITMMVPIFLCVVIAVWLNSLLDTVLFMPIFLILGIGAAFRNAWLLVKSYTKNDKSTEAEANREIRRLRGEAEKKKKSKGQQP